MRCDVDPTSVPTLDLDSPTLAADVACALDRHGLAVTVNDPHKIASITDDGGVAKVTTQAPHGITDTTPVVVSGTSNPAYNRSGFADGVITPTTFLFGAYDGNSVGGRWDAT